MSYCESVTKAFLCNLKILGGTIIIIQYNSTILIM